MGSAESHAENHCKKSSKNDAKYGGNKEVSIKSGEQNSVLLPRESCLASGCHASDPSLQASEDVIDGSNSPSSTTQDRKKVETSSFSVSFQRESAAEDNYSSRPFLQTTEEVFSGGPALSNIENISKNWMQNNSRSTCYGGGVVADGYTPEVSSQRSEHVRVNHALKAGGSSQPNAKEERNSTLSKSSCRRSSKKDVFAGSITIERSLQSETVSHVPFPKQDKSWHFPSPLVNSEHCVKPGNLLASDHSDSAKYFDQETFLQDCGPLFDDSTTRSPYKEMRSLADEYMTEQGSQGGGPEHSESCTKEHSVGVSELKLDSHQGSQETLLECLRTVMSTTVHLFASNNVSQGQAKQNNNKAQQTQKLSIEEKAMGENCDRTGTAEEAYLREQAASLPRNERITDTEEEDHTSPVQKSSRPSCGHYQRRCPVRFPCCGRFYPCHRCHDESASCTDDQARAINATHIRCTICYHEQVVRS